MRNWNNNSEVRIYKPIKSGKATMVIEGVKLRLDRIHYPELLLQGEFVFNGRNQSYNLTKFRTNLVAICGETKQCTICGDNFEARYNSVVNCKKCRNAITNKKYREKYKKNAVRERAKEKIACKKRREKLEELKRERNNS